MDDVGFNWLLGAEQPMGSPTSHIGNAQAVKPKHFTVNLKRGRGMQIYVTGLQAEVVGAQAVI